MPRAVFWFKGKGAGPDKLVMWTKAKDSGDLQSIFHLFLKGSRHNLAARYYTASNLRESGRMQ